MESDGLAGTTWKGWSETLVNPGPSYRTESKLVFESSTVDFSGTVSMLYGNEEEIFDFSGTYTYDHPTVIITVTSPEELAGQTNIGVVIENEMWLQTDLSDRYGFDRILLGKN